MKKKNIIFTIMNIVFLSCCSPVDDSSFLSEEPSSSQSDDISTSENCSFVIRFDPNGGNGTMNDQFVDCDEFVLNKNTFTKPGYNFVGWSLEPNGYVDFADCEDASGIITQNTTLYAIYEFAYSKVADLIDDYNNRIKDIDKDVYAYYGGKDDKDISKYIPDFNKELANSFELQFGKLVYVGNDSSQYENMTSNFIPISQSYRNAHEISLLDAYLELAYSYYYQGVQIQYDQGSSYQRKIRDMVPEDATELYQKYMDCSTYVSNCFYNAFDQIVVSSSDINSVTTKVLIDYAKINVGQSNEVILYQDNLKNLTSDEKNIALETFKNTIQPGDLYVYRHTNDSAGHVMLYLGDGYFLHSTGSSYNYSSLTDKVESYTSVQGEMKPEGSVRYQSANSTVYNSSSTRYLFYEDPYKTDSNDRYALLRPLNRKGLSLTPTTIARCMNSGIEIEKSADKYTSVSVGDTITYTITITNNSKKSLKNISINDELTDDVTFVEMSKTEYYNNDGKHLIWNIPSIDSKQSVKLSYKVLVTNDETKIGSTISSKGSVGHINLNTVNLSINSFSSSNYNDFVKMALQYYNNSNVYYDKNANNSTLDPTNNVITFNNGANFVTTLYKRYYSSLGKEFDLTSELENVTNTNLMDSIFDTDGNFNASGKLYKMLVNGGYGGIVFKKDYTMDRMRTVKKEYLLPGDIISFSNSSATNQYLYLGDIKIDSTKYETAFLLFTTTDGVKLVYDDASKELLVKFIGYNRFAVIRPSLYI